MSFRIALITSPSGVVVVRRRFFCDEDYHQYKSLIAHYARAAGTEIWAYCLMPNHVHLILVPTSEDGLRSTLAEAHRRHARRINAREGWRGHLWQERFYSFPMDESHLVAAARYVEMNPVAAGICTHPGDWRWSSARAHLSGADDGLVRVQPLLDRVSGWGDFLSESASGEEAESIRQHNRSGRPLGLPEFVRKLEEQTGRNLAPRNPGRKPLSQNSGNR